MVAKRRSSSLKKRSHKGGLRKQLGNVVTKVPNAVLIVGEGGVDAVSNALKGASTKVRKAFNHAGKIIKGDKKVVNLPMALTSKPSFINSDSTFFVLRQTIHASTERSSFKSK